MLFVCWLLLLLLAVVCGRSFVVDDVNVRVVTVCSSYCLLLFWMFVVDIVFVVVIVIVIVVVVEILSDIFPSRRNK